MKLRVKEIEIQHSPFKCEFSSRILNYRCSLLSKIRGLINKKFKIDSKKPTKLTNPHTKEKYTKPTNAFFARRSFIIL
jgi:hypothetical protein